MEVIHINDSYYNVDLGKTIITSFSEILTCSTKKYLDSFLNEHEYNTEDLIIVIEGKKMTYTDLSKLNF